MGDLNLNFPYEPVGMYSLSCFYPDGMNNVLELQSLEQDNWKSIRREIPFLLIFPMAGRLYTLISTLDLVMRTFLQQYHCPIIYAFNRCIYLWVDLNDRLIVYDLSQKSYLSVMHQHPVHIRI